MEAEAALDVKNRVKIAGEHVGEFDQDDERNQKNDSDEGKQDVK